MINIFQGFEGTEVSFQNTSNDQMDVVVSLSASVKDYDAEFFYSIHSKPMLQIARLGQFHELEFTSVKNMPRGFFEQASAWHHALLEICRIHRGIGWLAIRMEHSSDLLPLAVHMGFLPVLTDDDTQIVIIYLAPKMDDKLRDKVITSANKQAIESNCFFGSVLLHEAIPLDLATCKQGDLNVGLRLLAPVYEKMYVYGIDIVLNNDSDMMPAPYIPYAVLGNLLKHVCKQDFEHRLVGVAARNRHECLACLEAGFFPLRSEVKDETLFVRYF